MRCCMVSVIGANPSHSSVVTLRALARGSIAPGGTASSRS